MLDLASLREEYFFVPGLICFLTAHLFFIAAFSLSSSQSSVQNKRKTYCHRLIPSSFSTCLRSLPFFAVCGFLIYFIWPGIPPELQAPVPVYALIIALMGSFAAFRLGRSSDATPNSQRLAFFGAIIFMISDSMIAVHKFYFSFPYSYFWIMFTYYFAQDLICLSAIQSSSRTR